MASVVPSGQKKNVETDPRLFLLGSSVEDEGRALTKPFDWIYTANDLTDSGELIAC